MAVFTYTTTNVTFSSFDTWSNSIASDSNVSLDTVLNDAYPASSRPEQVSEIYNRSWFYGNVVGTGNGTVQVTYPYTSATSTGTIQIKNVDYSVYAYIRLVAVGTYPFNFSQWRTAAGGGGTQISTSATLDLTVSDYTSQTNFYAYFV